MSDRKTRTPLLNGPLGRRNGLEDYEIDIAALRHIGWGFGLSSSGGGGSFVDGIQLTEDMIAKGFTSIAAKSITSAPLGEYAAIAGIMGAPSAIGSLTDFTPTCIAALDALADSGFVPGPISGVTPIEAGPVNGLMAVAMCFASNGQYTLYDCDGAGRAVPSLTNLLFDFEGISFSPSAQTSPNGEPANINTSWANGAQGEAGLRDVIASFGGAIGLAAWAQDGTTLSNATLPVDTFATAATRGERIQSLKSNGLVLQAWLESLAPNVQFEGLTWHTSFDELYRDPDGLAQGYDKGYIAFGRDDIEAGFEYRLYYLNENMFISKHETATGAFVNYVVTAPSTIACFFADPAPPAVLGAQAGDYIPYNTGDLDIVEGLVGQQIIISVSSPTELLYSPEVTESFVAVLNDYFGADPYGFSFATPDIFPTSGAPDARRR